MRLSDAGVTDNHRILVVWVSEDLFTCALYVLCRSAKSLLLESLRVPGSPRLEHCQSSCWKENTDLKVWSRNFCSQPVGQNCLHGLIQIKGNQGIPFSDIPGRTANPNYLAIVQWWLHIVHVKNTVQMLDITIHFLHLLKKNW